jgi:hypothetical protein
MAYLLLIHEPVGQRGERSEAEGQAVYDRMLQFAAELDRRGVLQGVNSLSAKGKRIEVREGTARLLDGPFAEAKEMVGGYFLVDCATEEEALAIARQCPAAEWATVEVRAVGPCYT